MIPEPNGNGHVRPGRVKPLPKGNVNFLDVVGLLRNGNPATAFTKAAETMLERFEDLRPEMTAVGVLKMAIELHKHGLFCEVAQDKARTAHDAAAYDKFQEYLNGTTDVPVAGGLPSAASAKASTFDVDAEGDDDGEAEGT